jgi:hypothetical protein
MPRAVFSLISQWRGTLEILRLAGLRQMLCATFLLIERASVLPQMPLQVRELHASTNSTCSGTAWGEASVSANSR